jgi:hypothetical protein
MIFPAVGSARGILLEFNSSLFNSIIWEVGQFFIIVYLKNIFDKAK